MIVGTGASLSHGGVGGGVTSGTVEGATVDVVVVAGYDGETMPLRSIVTVGIAGNSWPPASQAVIDTAAVNRKSVRDLTPHTLPRSGARQTAFTGP